jgi:hypothetical protein
VYNGDQTQSDIFNIADNTWRSTGRTKIGRAMSQIVSSKTRTFVLAGWGGSLGHTNTVEEYNYDLGTWTLAPNSMVQPRRYFGAITVPALMFRDMLGGCVGIR